MTRDASSQDLIPDPSFLPRSEEWQAVPQEDVPEVNEDTRKPLCNGNLSPGVQTYRDRLKELQMDNTAAFRTIRRIAAPAGETPARLGNSYEFYKNLEFFSGYWPDTSLPSNPEPSSSDDKDKEIVPPHLQTHVRTGTGSQMPADYRQSLLSSFIKLVAYDFGCNVSFPRVEPRLILTHPPAQPTTPPPTYFNSAAMFVYRTPTDRGAARSGIVEGPVAALSSRSTTGFTTELDEHLDMAREVVATLLTAQQRAREGKTEVRFGEGKWWTSTPRWGGGPGGPIGKEGDRIEEAERAAAANALTPDTALAIPTSKSDSPAPPEKAESKVTAEAKRLIHSITGPTSSGPPSSSSASGPTKRTKKSSSSSSTLPIYDNYRKLLPPTPTWDRKARYLSIGRVPGASYDDIFLVSALNHHISIVRTRVPSKLLEVLDGSHEVGEWERVEMWRSRWFDVFLAKDRVEAMEVVWGMMGWLMRKIEEPVVAPLVPDAVTTTAKDLARSRSVKMTGTSGEPIAVRTVELDAASEKRREEGEKMDLS